MVKKIPCAYFWVVLALWSIFCLFLAPIYLLITGLRGQKTLLAARYGTWLYGRIFLALVRPVLRVRLRGGSMPPVFGHLAGNAIKSGRVLILNHQSFIDSYLIGCWHDWNICQIVRAWPFKKLFFFSPLMRLAQYIESEGQSPEDTISACERELQQGTSLVCFPEGHRSRDGKLRRFHSGVFVAAINADAPVFPMVIHNSGSVCPPGLLKFNRGEIVISFLPPIYPQDFKEYALPHLAMARQVRKTMGDAQRTFLQ